MNEQKLTGYPSIDKPWLKYYSEEAINTPLPESTIYGYMYESNREYPKDIALIYFNRKITYGEMFKNIDRAASAFIALGVKQGDIVTVALPSIPEAVYVVYALNKLGAVANMIHPLAGEQEIVNYLNEVNSKVFVMFTDTYGIVKNALDRTSVETSVVISSADSLSFPLKQLYRLKTKEKLPEQADLISYSAFISGGKGTSVPEVKRSCHDVAIISHTGGTTGEPKGCMLTDYNCNSVISQVNSILSNIRQERMLVPLPPFINYSLCDNIFEPLATGVSVILIPDYQEDHIYEYIEKYRPNNTRTIPMYCEALLNSANSRKMDLSCLKYVYYGGEAMSAEVEKEINELLISQGARFPLGKGLGSTELTSVATFTPPNCNVKASAGIPMPYMNCKIVEPKTYDELTYGQTGEICITGPSLMVGYYNKQEATDEIIKIHPDGKRWIHTGDLGYINDDGVLFVNGRIKRIAMTKGSDGVITKIFPERIEKVLAEHESVDIACVIAVEDKERIHYPKAFVILKQGFSSDESVRESILSVCREKLPGYMVPEEIEFTTELPRTPRGKVDYRALEERANATYKEQ